MLGHKNITTTQVYLQTTLADLQRVIKDYHPRARDNQVKYVSLEELEGELKEELNRE